MEHGRGSYLSGKAEAPRGFCAMDLDGFTIFLGKNPNDINYSGKDLTDKSAFPGTDEDTATRRSISPSRTIRESARPTAPGEPCAVERELLNTLPLGNFFMRVRRLMAWIYEAPYLSEKATVLRTTFKKHFLKLTR